MNQQKYDNRTEKKELVLLLQDKTFSHTTTNTIRLVKYLINSILDENNSRIGTRLKKIFPSEKLV